MLVQFVGPDQGRVAREAARPPAPTVLGYAAQNAYIVHAAGDALDRVTELVGSYPAVRAATALRPADKVERGAASGRVAVQTVAGAPGADARAEAAGDGAQLAPDLSAVHVRTQFLDLSAAEVADSPPTRRWWRSSPPGVPKLHDERAAQIVAGNLTGNAPSGPGYDAWLTTKGFGAPFGFAIDVTDSGLDQRRHDGRPPGPARPRGLRPRLHRRPRRHGLRRPRHERRPRSPRAWAPLPGRTPPATSTASAWRRSRRWAPRRSSAAAARPLRSTTPRSPPTPTPAAPGSRTTHGASRTSAATTRRRRHTTRWYATRRRATPGNQEMVEVFSAGNDGDGKGNPLDPKGDEGYGSITSPGTAKNVITVGASESVRGSGTDGCGVTNGGADSASDIINFSGRGPTQDGRMKPDLVAPGTHITGASPQHAGYTGAGVCNTTFGGSSFYSLVSGTSQAAPHVAGRGSAAARLVRAHGEPDAAVAGHDQGDAREHRGRPRRGQQWEGQLDPRGAEHGRGLGPREHRRRARRRPSASTSTRGPRPSSTRPARACCAPTRWPTRRSRCGSRSRGPTRRRPRSPATPS